MFNEKMVKFGKHKFKALNKLAKKQELANTSGLSNKVLKKKVNADKKVTFQKEIILNELAALDNNALVKSVTAKDIHNEQTKKYETKRVKTTEQTQKPKQKPVEKHKKRQKTQLNDTKLLLSLMKNRK